MQKLIQILVLEDSKVINKLHIYIKNSIFCGTLIQLSSFFLYKTLGPRNKLEQIENRKRIATVQWKVHLQDDVISF